MVAPQTTTPVAGGTFPGTQSGNQTFQFPPSTPAPGASAATRTPARPPPGLGVIGGTIPPPPPPPKPSSVIAPRVGGIIDGTAWVGGTARNQRYGPKTVNCFRPQGFRDRQKTEEKLTKGLKNDRHLEIGGNIAATTFMKEAKRLLTANGLDTVFCMTDVGTYQERNLLDAYGSYSMSEVTASVNALRNGSGPDPNNNGRPMTAGTPCPYDLQNLELSASFLRDSIGPKLYASTESDAIEDISGPEYFMLIVNKVAGTSAQAVRNMSNSLASMRLDSEPEENVSTFTAKVTEMCTRIAGTNYTPPDLTFLAIRPYTYCSDHRWCNYAGSVAIKYEAKDDSTSWTSELPALSARYSVRLNQGDWEPANHKKSAKEKDESTSMALMANEVTSVKEKLNAVLKIAEQGKGFSGGDGRRKMNCHSCGSSEHLQSECPSYKDKWKYAVPATGEATEKTVDGTVYKFCAKCRRGKGIWNKTHLTEAHVDNYLTKKRAGTETPSGPPAAAATGHLACDTDGLDFIDSDLVIDDFGFLAYEDDSSLNEFRGRQM